jgi:Domain of unknown function (DUF4338)/DDE_Tnp_1-associated
MESWRTSLVVRPAADDEVGRFAAEMAEHHWLGPRLSGRVMRYVATVDGEWVALAGFGSAALRVPVREEFVGWDEPTRSRRLGLVAASQRLCVLPAGRRPNVASAVLGACLRRLSRDYLGRYGHPVLVVETFTDPSRHSGACYAAAGFTPVGDPAGYGRVRGGRLVHGQPKTYWLRPLHRRALAALAGCFDSPLARPAAARPAMVVDLNAVPVDGEGGLVEALAALADPRHARGVRHDHAALLAVATAAVLCGATGYTEIADWSANAPQPALARLGVRHRHRGLYVAPSYHTLRRTLRAVDTGQLDTAVGAWLWRQVRAGAVSTAVARSLAHGAPPRLFAPIVAGSRRGRG